jgi:sulfate transport system permease protein
MRTVPRRPVKSLGAAVLVLFATAWLALVVGAPLATVFAEALAKGVAAARASLDSSETQSAIGLTFMVAAISVPLNTIFGLAAAWTVSRFEFVGKSLLVSLIDLPFSMSPVVSGLVWVLLFGANGWFAPILEPLNLKILFALPGLVLATVVVTFPFVARELMPLMQAQGAEEELAAVTLGARAPTIFWRITLPNIRWGLLYGVLLCNARAMGEFGAVSVVSGHIRGLTNTLPLQVEALYNDYDSVGAFTAAALLASLALVTLVAKTVIERRFASEI